MNSTLAILFLLSAMIMFVFAIVTLIRQTENADVERQSASTTYNRTWASASLLAAVSLTWLFDLRWPWIGLFWCAWLLIGWYGKWFGVSILGGVLLHRPVGLWDWQATPHMQNVPRRRAVTRPVLILSVVWVLISAVFVLLASLELDHEASLLQDGVVTNASVTDNRISYRSSRYNSGYSYDVQYQFSLNDGASWYTASDATGRSNLWRSLAKSDYDTAITSEKIEVLYLPSNPWINRPVKSTSADLPTLLLIDLLWLVSIGLGFSVSRRYVTLRLGQQAQTS